MASHGRLISFTTQPHVREASFKIPGSELFVRPNNDAPQKTSKVPLVYVVILNYNNFWFTEQCLYSLKRLDYPNYQVLLVDNGSDDLPMGQLRECFSDIEIFKNSHNLGFAGGSNRGILVALTNSAEYIWLLNNDARVEPQALTAMVAEAEADPHVGAVGSLLVSDDPGRGLQAWGGGRVNFLLGLPEHVRSGPPPSLDYLCGASLLLRSRALHEVGLFDEGYFLYWEDTDLCFRLRAKGWKLAVAEGSLITHRESGTLGFQSTLYDYHFTSSSIRFFRRHGRYWLWPVMVSVSGRMIRRALCGEWGNVSVVWKGFLEGIATKESR